MKTKEKPKTDKVEIVVVLDRSGSMSPQRKDTIGGFNTFLSDCSRDNPKAKITLIKFDHEYDVAYSSVPIKDVKEMTEADYVPRGNTALLDAMGRAIGEISSSKIKKKLICVLTDGGENASREWTSDRIKALVTEKRADGWEFVFLADDPTATHYAIDRLGVNALLTGETRMSSGRMRGVTQTARCYGESTFIPGDLLSVDRDVIK